jgi:hypothetical protein
MALTGAIIRDLLERGLHYDLLFAGGWRNMLPVTGGPAVEEFVVKRRNGGIVATIDIKEDHLVCTSAFHGDFDFHLSEPDSLHRFEYWIKQLRPRR